MLFSKLQSSHLTLLVNTNTNFSNTSPFFHPWDRKNFALCLQCSHFHSNDSEFISKSSRCRTGPAIHIASPVLHWQPYLTTSLKQQRIYQAWVSSEQSHMLLAVATPYSPRKPFAKLFAGRTGPCPINEGISFKQSGLRQASTNALHVHSHQQGLGN